MQNDKCSKMAVFNDIVCIRADNDVEKVQVTKHGEIKHIHFFENICQKGSLDIISDDIGDFWISDFNMNIKKVEK